MLTDVLMKSRPSAAIFVEKGKTGNTSKSAAGFGGTTRNRTGDKGFADPCLTAWPWCQQMERETGLEPATSALARQRSTE